VVDRRVLFRVIVIDQRVLFGLIVVDRRAKVIVILVVELVTGTFPGTKGFSEPGCDTLESLDYRNFVLVKTMMVLMLYRRPNTIRKHYILILQCSRGVLTSF